MEGALQLAPKEPIAEDLGPGVDHAMLGPGGRFARVDVLEEQGPAALVDVVFEQTAKHTAILFSGGLSVAEYEGSTLQTQITTPTVNTVSYVRGPDMGGGVGGLLYSTRTETGGERKVRYNLSNGRGDIVAQSDESATLTWTASYEAYGKRPTETGENLDKQRANSKDEDPTGLLNEGFRYRDIETGVWLSRDPAGFVDGPNLYAYVKQNPWSFWDPKGLSTAGKVNKLVKTVKKVNGRYPINAKFAEKGKASFDDLSESAKKNYDYLKNDPTFDGVTWKKTGYPDFTKYSRVVGGKTDFTPGDLTMDVGKDVEILRKHLGLSSGEMNMLMKNHTLHHVEDSKTLQIVRSDVHDAFKHTGGRANAKELAAIASSIVAPNSTELFAKGNVTVGAVAKAALADVGDAVDPGIGLVATRENAEKAGRGFWNAVDGSGDYADHSQTATYNMGDSLKGVWKGIKDFVTGADLD